MVGYRQSTLLMVLPNIATDHQCKQQRRKQRRGASLSPRYGHPVLLTAQDTLTPDDGSMAILSKAAQASVNANAGVPADVDAKRDQGSVAQSEPSQPADACTVHIDSVRKTLSCQLCHELVRGSNTSVAVPVSLL